MRIITLTITVIIIFGCASDRAGRQEKLSVICSVVPQSDRPLSPVLYEDITYIFSGPLLNIPTRGQAPGILVYSKNSGILLRIEKVSTKGATFGRTPTAEECEALFTGFPPIGSDNGKPAAEEREKLGTPFSETGGDNRKLAEHEYVDLSPRKSAGGLVISYVLRDSARGEISLHFDSHGPFKGTETILKFKASDLEKAFEEARRKIYGSKDTSGDK